MIATRIGTQTISISNPTGPNRLGINASLFGYTNLLICPFLDRWAVEVFLPISKPKAYRLNVALKADRATTWQF
jgi:hypothetical protein